MKKTIDDILSQLTLEEKAALCSGINNWETTPVKRLGIPSVMMTDGPHGLRKEVEEGKITNIFKGSVPSTCFPPAVTLASSWDKDLACEVGDAIAREALYHGVTTVLGPGINIKRSPLCGRNFEYFSEDPYLSGEMAAAYIDGVQKNGAGTSLKHYAVNNQEYRRLTISSEVDERALREIYLRAFETAVKRSQPYTIMCSYNLINGIHASDNKKLLNDILRDEWGFEGIVVSDWGAVNNRVKGIVAGLDLEMPSSNGYNDSEIVRAVKANVLDEKDLDVVVKRMLKYVFKCAEAKEKAGKIRVDYEKHHLLARRAAADGAVLLKNKNDILPLKQDSDIAVIGKLARQMRYQGSGSSRLTPKKLVSFCDYLDSLNVKYAYSDGYTLNGSGYSEKYITKAVESAKGKDYVLVFAGLTDEYESEGFDRTHLEMPWGQNELISALCEVCDRVIVVLSCGSPVEMPWFKDVSAILNLYLGGEAGGEAAYDLLYGAVSPSGKLAETFPLNLDDCMATKYFGMGPKSVQYRESIYVGYRYYDTAGKGVLFPFGFGLSYTRFNYGNLELSRKKMGKKHALKVSFDISNTGDYDGAEVAQVYVRDLASTHFTPNKELKGFKKVYLKKSETKTVTVELGRDAFSFYNTEINDWCVESGDFEILVGSSARDIHLSGVVKVEGEEDSANIPDYTASAPLYYHLSGAREIPQEQFEALIGRKMPDDLLPKKGELDMNSTLEDAEVSMFGRIVKRGVYRFSDKVLPKDAGEFEKKMVREGAMSMPVRSFFAMTNGAITYEASLGLLKAFNGETVKGLFDFSKAMFSKKPPRKSDIYK